MDSTATRAAQFGFHFSDRMAERTIAGGRVEQRSQLAEIAAGFRIHLGELRRGRMQIALGERDGFAQFFDEALCLGVAQILETLLELVAQCRGQSDGPLAIGALHLEIEHFRLAEFGALGRTELHRSGEAGDFLIGRPRRLRLAIGRRSDGLKSRRNDRVALRQFENCFLHGFHIFGDMKPAETIAAVRFIANHQRLRRFPNRPAASWRRRPPGS